METARARSGSTWRLQSVKKRTSVLLDSFGMARGSQWPRRRRCGNDEPARANEIEREVAREGEGGARVRLGVAGSAFML